MISNAETLSPADNAETGTLINLQSKDHEESLNVVDLLRSQGISKYVDVPQIIVCGDQSSGKSSVLGAISDISFPWKDNICTRFAIELILRRATDPSVSISIFPDDDRPAEEQERLQSFKSPTVGLSEFATIVKSAEEHIGVGGNGLPFSKDVLRVEVSGPTLPHLTLVDLPGLYHAADENQDDEGVRFVESLVLSYMQKSRSLILAVVSAKSDIVLQQVTAFTRQVDPHGERTMGIITKPDTLSNGSEMQQSFFKLARNERVRFRLGWHVLKNRSYEERSFTISQRHESESTFFAGGIWSSLPRSQVGVSLLRPRLSTVLRDHILSQMPGFVDEIQSTLKDAEDSARKLGHSRRMITEQRRYLLYNSERFTVLMGDALNGIYFDPFFGNSMDDEGYQKRLRAVIQNRLYDFAEMIREYGEHRKIVDGDDAAHNDRTCISRSDYMVEVQQRMRRSRGQELPGTFNPLIIGELFYLQSKPWEAISSACIETILGDVRKTIMFILQEVLDERSIHGLLNHVINQRLSSIEKELQIKTKELLKPQQAGHPITYNHYFTDTIQKARTKHHRQLIEEKLKSFFGADYAKDPTKSVSYYFSMTGLITALESSDDTNMEQFAAREAITCMQAYYKAGPNLLLRESRAKYNQVARKKFVDDFSNLAVEKCLLEPLFTLFCSKTVESLTEETIGDIAREDENTMAERDRLEKKIRTLQDSLKKLQRLNRPDLTNPSRSPELGHGPRTFDCEKNTQLENGVITDGSGLPAHTDPSEDLASGKEVDLKADLDQINEDEWTFSSRRPPKKKKRHPSADLWEPKV